VRVRVGMFLVVVVDAGVQRNYCTAFGLASPCPCPVAGRTLHGPFGDMFDREKAVPAHRTPSN